MGLCKCPKKKVTNLFCFEHRVNVCEFCLVCDHSKCIVQSYLQWLQDSDYSTDCQLCKNSLVDQECVRLLCYDVFHWKCLSDSVSQLPGDTAPAGYECPTCNSSIIPQANMAGPVAEQLRVKLKDASWARAGLGLPVQQALPVESNLPENTDHSLPFSSTPLHNGQVPPPLVINEHNPRTGNGAGQPFLLDMHDHTVPTQGIRKPRHHTPVSTHFDSDEDKYRRRPAMDWLAQWVRSVVIGVGRPGRSSAKSTFRRFSVLLLLGVLAFLTVVLLLSRLGRNAADSDPMLDPAFNPNIRVQDGQDHMPAADGQVNDMVNGGHRSDMEVHDGQVNR